MRFVIACLGVPQAAFNAVRDSGARIAQGNGELVCMPLRHGASAYDQRYLGQFIEDFAGRVERDKDSKLRDTGFAAIYIQLHTEGDRLLEQVFFPSTLTWPIDWRIEHGTPTTQRRSINALVVRLAEAAASAKRAIEALSKEANERANKTPLLLPMKNFRSAILEERARALGAAVGAALDPEAAVREFAADFELTHPSTAEEPEGHRRKRSFGFTDDRGIFFRSPGRDRHAFARIAPGGEHPPACLLSGRRRLGAPYDPAFHYDCSRAGGATLDGAFHGCHEPPSPRSGNRHLNIAPNDFVRE